MKILVIGASGRTGKQVIKNLAGHNIIEFSGDIMDSEAVNLAVKGMDTVISVVGYTKSSDQMLQTIGIKNVVNAMNMHKVSRIISLTGTGVRMPNDKITIFDRVLNFGIKSIDPKRVKDGIMHTEYLQSSDVDWTVIRVLKLTNGEDKGDWKLTKNGPAKIFISRKSVAKAIATQINDVGYYKSSPIIAKI
ncbi:MAG: putative NADH-flavin reductase [Candidatus Saccharimonadales bacterium]|jgi:putative NADH-flavin reductase